MKTLKPIYLSVALASFSANTHAELQWLDENSLSGVTGQAGLTVEIDAKVEIDQLSYTDDGNPLSLEGVSIHKTGDDTQGAHGYVMIDITADGEMQVRHIAEQAHLQVDDIRVDSDNTAPNSFGTIALDFDMENYFQFSGGGLYHAGKGMTVSNYNSRIFGLLRDENGDVQVDGSGNPITKGAEFFYRDNGNDLMVSFDYEHWGTDWTLDVVDDPYKSGQEALLITYPDHHFSLTVDQIKFKTRDTANNNFTSDPNNSGLDAQPNVGMITASADVNGELYISAGGKDPVQGLTFNYDQTLSNGDFRYIDTDSQGKQYEVALTGVTHQSQVTNLTFDVIGDSVWLQTERSEGTIDVENIYMGTEYNAGNDIGKTSLGSVHVDYLFEDQTINGTTYTNSLQLTPKGNQYGGDQGITINTNWSLANADIGYTDNGNTVWVSGIQSYGSGAVTFDLIDADYLYANNTVPSSEDPFFDGVRIGFEDVVAHYSIDGFKVGDDKNSATLQGGTELLLPLQVFQEADFTLNGHVTLLPGGADNDGLTFNSDLHLTDTTFGISVDEDRSGLWLDDVTYDIYMRDAKLDVTSDGLVFNRGWYASTMDIGNVRLGDKQSGDSLGRVVLSRLEHESTLSISSGGAGGVCIGGSGGDSTSCGVSGGRWEDRGDQGVTVAINSKFVDKDSLTADELAIVNGMDPNADTRIAWYRPDGKVGIEAVGISTNDKGLTVELGLDVAETVVKDVDQADGLLKRVLLDPTGQEELVADADLASKLASGYTNPVGFAVDTKIEFEQLNIDRINMNHHVGGAQPIFYGAQFENVSLRANITATPIR
ncbi:DUF6160 family protein [Litoribrevibacter albus]|uniref:DUF6160 domain-containing protein n=1 Tax=Litoribrevibacter albus TaxID=1473156 RepID=A0AA37W8H6_9GAMM|nr:DUF6160 family protein [Litoribrevibacter albus]GLQ32443.1 hypothetical protein GCM10007876_29220 [Litoribrevibacter albus]